MVVPPIAIGGIVALIVILGVIAIVSTFAWFGIAQQHEDLLARVKVMSIDVYDLKTPMRKIGPAERSA